MTAPSTTPRAPLRPAGIRLDLWWVPRAVVLGLLAFIIFGPLTNLVLWTVAERWYFPHALPLEYGFSYWGRVFSPRGTAMRERALATGTSSRSSPESGGSSPAVDSPIHINATAPAHCATRKATSRSSQAMAGAPMAPTRAPASA